MTDLDARIRAGLQEGDWSTKCLSNALRAVLDMCHNGDVALNGYVATDGIRYVLARELGVSE